MGGYMELDKFVIDELSNLKELIGVSEDYEKFIKYFAFIINNHTWQGSLSY